jgi:hypothetical protein
MLLLSIKSIMSNISLVLYATRYSVLKTVTMNMMDKFIATSITAQNLLSDVMVVDVLFSSNLLRFHEAGLLNIGIQNVT